MVRKRKGVALQSFPEENDQGESGRGFPNVLNCSVRLLSRE